MIDCPSVSELVVRRRSYLDFVRERELPVDGDWIVSCEQTAAGGAEAFDALRAAHPDLTAVFAFNDQVAIGAFQRARQAGVRIPDDCALMGFDGLSVGELLDPPLSTIHIDKRRLGELAVDQANRLLAGEKPEPAVLRPQLRIRGTA
jgi:LacI family transcriptional regulator